MYNNNENMIQSVFSLEGTRQTMQVRTIARRQMIDRTELGTFQFQVQ